MCTSARRSRFVGGPRDSHIVCFFVSRCFIITIVICWEERGRRRDEFCGVCAYGVARSTGNPTLAALACAPGCVVRQVAEEDCAVRTVSSLLLRADLSLLLRTDSSMLLRR